MLCFIAYLMTILVLIGMVFVIIWEMFNGRISLKSMLLLLVNFVSGFRLELMYISLSWSLTCLHGFSTACAAAIVHRNHFLRFYQQNKSSESKIKFGQASNRCNRVLKAAKLVYANKQKSPLFPKNLALENYGQLLIAFSTKVYLIHLFYSIGGRCRLLRTLILMI